MPGFVGSRCCAFQIPLPTVGEEQAWGRGGIGVWTYFVLEAHRKYQFEALHGLDTELSRGADVPPMQAPRVRGSMELASTGQGSRSSGPRPIQAMQRAAVGTPSFPSTHD